MPYSVYWVEFCSNLCCSDVDSVAVPSCIFLFFLSSTGVNSICDWISKALLFCTKLILHKIIRSYTQELYMHGVSTVQCELLCFLEGIYANLVTDATIMRMAPTEGINWVTMSQNCSHC